MARILCAAVLSAMAICHGAHVERQIGLQLDSSGPSSEDHLALLQHKVEPHWQQTKASALSGGRLSLLRGLKERRTPSDAELYCAAYPDYCKPPFNCHLVNFTEQQLRFDAEGLAPDGKPSLQSWCTNPEYLPFITRCAAGKLVEAAHVEYEQVLAGLHGEFTLENDGSYCFLEGHCANTAVTENTTMEDMVQMCDERFGHEAWTLWGTDRTPEDTLGYGMELMGDPRNGFNSPKQTRPFMLAGCAMGNFHCDIMYCRETYCKNGYFIQKYGHLLREFGWVK